MDDELKFDPLTELEFHDESLPCSNYGERVKSNRWKRNGKTKTYARRLGVFKIPVRFGYWGVYGYITEKNAAHFHGATSCPKNRRSEVGSSTEVSSSI